MLFDLGLEFLRVEFAPVSPACFRGQRACFGGLQIPINGTPGQVKPPGGLGFGPARLDEVHHPFPQVQRISFHALKPVTLCPNVNMKCYIIKLMFPFVWFTANISFSTHLQSDLSAAHFMSPQVGCRLFSLPHGRDALLLTERAFPFSLSAGQFVRPPGSAGVPPASREPKTGTRRRDASAPRNCARVNRNGHYAPSFEAPADCFPHFPSPPRSFLPSLP